MSETIAEKTAAINSLTPLATFKVDDSGVTWTDTVQTEPTAAEITAEIAVQAAASAAVAYKINRIKEYIENGGRLDFMLLDLWENVVNSDTSGTTSTETNYKTTVDLNNPAP